MADPLILVRGVHFAATLLACGTVAFTVLVAEPAGTKVQARSFHHKLTTLIWLALAAAILSGAVWLVLLASDILGASFVDICLHGGAWPVLFDTRFGLVWCARFALALLLGLLMLWPVARGLQLAAASALAALPALVGHAGATPGIAGEIHLVSDMVHLLASSAWLGGLPAFVLLLVASAPNGGADLGTISRSGRPTAFRLSASSASVLCWRAASSTAGI